MRYKYLRHILFCLYYYRRIIRFILLIILGEKYFKNIIHYSLVINTNYWILINTVFLPKLNYCTSFDVMINDPIITYIQINFTIQSFLSSNKYLKSFKVKTMEINHVFLINIQINITSTFF